MFGSGFECSSACSEPTVKVSPPSRCRRRRSFALAQTRDAAIGVVAMVSNSGDRTGEQFDTGEHAYRVAVLNGIIAGAARFIRACRSQTSCRTATKAKR